MKFTGERFVECDETAGKQIEREHWQRYLMAADLLKPEHVVLDIACGTGYGTKHLSKFAAHVYGVDISAEAIDYAKEHYRGDNLDFFQGNVIQIPLPDKSIDVVVSFETIEHVDENMQRAFLLETKRVLKSGGIFIVSCPNKTIASDLVYELWGSVNEFHKKEYTEIEFKALLLDYFDGVSMLYQRNENALIMDAPGANMLKIQWGYRKKRTDTQNMIAVCGTEAIDITDFSCIIPDVYNQSIESQKMLAQYVKTVKSQRMDIEHLIKLKDKAETELQHEIACLYDLKIDFEKTILAKDKEIKDNIDYIGQLESAVAQKDKDLENNNDYIGQLESAIARKDSDLKNNSAYIAEMQNAISDNLKSIEYNQKSLSDALNKLKKHEKQIVELTETIDRQQSRIVELETIEQSCLWRCTKPVRVVLDVCKSIFR